MIDAPADVPIDMMPLQPAHQFVLSRVEVSDVPAGAGAFSLDLDGDGVPDNRLGTVLAELPVLAVDGFSIAKNTEEGVNHGATIALLTVRADSLTASPNASGRLERGHHPLPTACEDDLDQVCGRHLQGDASFQVVEDAATATMAGAIVASVVDLAAGRGRLELRVAPGVVMSLALERLRLRLTVSDADRHEASGELAGAIAASQLDVLVHQPIAAAAMHRIQVDCPTGCVCASMSGGLHVRELFDADRDCTITSDEVAEVLANLRSPNTPLTPDLDLNGDGTDDAVSFGVRVSTVRATYTDP